MAAQPPAPMTNDGTTLYLVDGSGYIFRAFYALPQLNNSRGMPTNAVYGFVRMLLKLLKDAHPARLAIVFDSPKKTFRDDLFESYKANRTSPPSDLVVQIPYIHRLVEALRIKSLILGGYEADDLIGTLAVRAARRKIQTVIVTADKDFMQLVGPHVTLWDTMRDKRTGTREVRERLGRGTARGGRPDGADGRRDRQRQGYPGGRRENGVRPDPEVRLTRPICWPISTNSNTAISGAPKSSAHSSRSIAPTSNWRASWCASTPTCRLRSKSMIWIFMESIKRPPRSCCGSWSSTRCCRS